RRRKRALWPYSARPSLGSAKRNGLGAFSPLVESQVSLAATRWGPVRCDGGTSGLSYGLVEARACIPIALTIRSCGPISCSGVLSRTTRVSTGYTEFGSLDGRRFPNLPNSTATERSLYSSFG